MQFVIGIVVSLLLLAVGIGVVQGLMDRGFDLSTPIRSFIGGRAPTTAVAASPGGAS